MDRMTPVGILQVGQGPLNFVVQSLQMRWPFWHCSMGTRGRLRQVVQITSSLNEASRAVWDWVEVAEAAVEDVPDIFAWNTRDKVQMFFILVE